MKAIIAGLAVAILVSTPFTARAAASPQQTTVKPADATLDESIEVRINRDAGLKAHDIKVDVANGVVTLTGTVANDAERARAARLARIKGVSRVDNQIIVSHDAKGTKGTLERAADSTKEGVGKAAEKTKEGASVAVDKTKEGVKKVGSEVTDAFVLAAIKAHFVGEDVLKGSDINVDVDKHVATLRGTVPTAAAKARAVELARTTNGVDRVVDMLVIGPKR